jgi:predicted CxxxxCH...CXXCH cytochrome family protein
MDLTGAAWNSATRTCTNVACHQAETSVAFGQPFREPIGPECNRCHNY